MKLISLAAALLLTASAAAHAQNTFNIVSNGSPAGKCVYSFDKAKDGFKVNSRYQVRTVSQFKDADPSDPIARMGSSIQQSHSYKLDAAYAYTGGNMIDSASQVNSGFSPNKQHTEMLLTSVQGGLQGASKDLPLKPAFIVAPLYDASAIQSLLFMATTHPTADSLYFFIVPQDRKPPMTGQVKWTALTDTTGTLDGKPIKLHHYGFSYGTPTYNIYADENNTLMQVDLSQGSVSYVRSGFVLAPQS
ncbi:MAG: hypothetical protein P4L10_05375 [Acidobacteriaceae bacterium]|nr:hypothetical protein [Acidobacteriaceae bacterium]